MPRLKMLIYNRKNILYCHTDVFAFLLANHYIQANHTWTSNHSKKILFTRHNISYSCTFDVRKVQFRSM